MRDVNDLVQLNSSDGRGQFYQCLLDCGIGRRGRFEGFDYSDDSENFYTKAVAYLSEQRGTDASERFTSTLHIGLEFLKMFFGEDKVRDVVDEMCRSSPCSRLLDLLNLRHRAEQGMRLHIYARCGESCSLHTVFSRVGGSGVR